MPATDKSLWNKIFRKFREVYSDLWVKGTSFEPHSYLVIKVRIPTKGIVLYDYRDDSLKWIRYWVDEKNAKEHDNEIRQEMYEEFCWLVEKYLSVNDMTHGQFSDRFGISRRSLSRYLNGDQIPKVSTMRRICDDIGINIDRHLDINHERKGYL